MREARIIAGCVIPTRLGRLEGGKVMAAAGQHGVMVPTSVKQQSISGQ